MRETMRDMLASTPEGAITHRINNVISALLEQAKGRLDRG